MEPEYKWLYDQTRIHMPKENIGNKMFFVYMAMNFMVTADYARAAASNDPVISAIKIINDNSLATILLDPERVISEGTLTGMRDVKAEAEDILKIRKFRPELFMKREMLINKYKALLYLSDWLK